MNTMSCETARELLPGYVGDALDKGARADVARHLEACDDCRSEAELLALLSAGAPPVPAGLSERIQAAVRAQQPRARRGASRPWWGLAAAAVAALALGIGVTSHETTTTQTQVPEYVAGVDSENLWLSDDGLIAGAPALDDLSDDALATLLEEMTVGGQA